MPGQIFYPATGSGLQRRQQPMTTLDQYLNFADAHASLQAASSARPNLIQRAMHQNPIGIEA